MSIWRNDLVHACPGITIPRHWTAYELRANKPSLFHAVMAAAAHSKGSELSDKLHEEAVYLYARSAFINGEKSVQSIQAMLVTVAYYSPPRSPGQLQIYQWVNMAASMALELGLASKPRTHEQLPKRAIRSLQKMSGRCAKTSPPPSVCATTDTTPLAATSARAATWSGTRRTTGR
ncbi:MAG: fungal specific transcription factor domain-containing protein [Oxalobacteraceae bacterium]|nr:MAG: fungal specific transcription factor domain-containing protein [Oxalobacteraceae bacterium]